MHMPNLVTIHQFILKILNGNKILTLIKCHNSVIKFWHLSKTIKSHNSVTNGWKLTLNNHNLDLVNINAYAKFDQIPSIHSQDTEWKRKVMDKITDNLKPLSLYLPILCMWGYKNKSTWAHSKLRSAITSVQEDQSLLSQCIKCLFVSYLHCIRVPSKLFRLCRCTGWSESSLGRQDILLVLLCSSSNVYGP